MESDLLFTLVKKQEWKEYSGKGKLTTQNLVEKGYLLSYEGDSIQEAANLYFEGEQSLYLLVIDPLRIQHPVKKEKVPFGKEVRIYGAVSVDAVIDRIQIQRNKDEKFSLKIKHFD